MQKKGGEAHGGIRKPTTAKQLPGGPCPRTAHRHKGGVCGQRQASRWRNGWCNTCASNHRKALQGKALQRVITDFFQPEGQEGGGEGEGEGGEGGEESGEGGEEGGEGVEESGEGEEVSEEGEQEEEEGEGEDEEYFLDEGEQEEVGGLKGGAQRAGRACATLWGVRRHGG